MENPNRKYNKKSKWKYKKEIQMENPKKKNTKKEIQTGNPNRKYNMKYK